ncbi:MAG: glucose-6-phosphate dehydrogenase, partial [Notoacmeibacter sp.]|nr:glucose-6-phosphate dehydrogenase [Notoacmeibacter sp.]
MTSTIIPVDPFDFIIFGATGDLAERKLLPALYQRQRDGQFSEPSRIIGASRSPMSDDAFRGHARQALERFVGPAERDEAEIARFLDRLSYVSVDATGDSGWADLAARLDDPARIRAFYLAVGPAIFSDIARRIRDHSLANAQTRIVVEKPIGRDLASAQALNDTIGSVFDESQIFRIDHY